MSDLTVTGKHCTYFDVDNSILFIPHPYLNMVFERADRYLNFKKSHFPINKTLSIQHEQQVHCSMFLYSCSFADSDVKL